MLKRKFGRDGESLERIGQWIRRLRKDRPLSLLLLEVGLVALFVILLNTIRLGGTGFKSRTLWEWMQLLLVPLVLAVGGWWVNKTQKDTEREQARAIRAAEWEIAQDQRQQQALETYLDRVSNLLLDYESQLDPVEKHTFLNQKTAISNVATAHTKTALRTLDGKRKGQVLQFLVSARLINNDPPVVSLSHAELRHVDLIVGHPSEFGLDGWPPDPTEVLRKYVDKHFGQDRWGVDLQGANLDEADLYQAALVMTNLTNGKLNSAYLVDAYLTGANLTKAKLVGAELQGADLYKAVLSGADFKNAKIRGASFVKASMPRADFREINIEDLKNADFTDAVRNEYTEFPEGFDPDTAGIRLVKTYQEQTPTLAEELD